MLQNENSRFLELMDELKERINILDTKHKYNRFRILWSPYRTLEFYEQLNISDKNIDYNLDFDGDHQIFLVNVNDWKEFNEKNK